MGGLLLAIREQMRHRLLWKGLYAGFCWFWLLFVIYCHGKNKEMELWGAGKWIWFLFLYYLSLGSNAALWAKLEKCMAESSGMGKHHKDNKTPQDSAKGINRASVFYQKTPRDFWTPKWVQEIPLRTNNSRKHLWVTLFMSWHNLNTVCPSVFSLMFFISISLWIYS